MNELVCETCRKDLQKEKMFFEDQMAPVKIFCTLCAISKTTFDEKLIQELLLDEKLFIKKYNNQNIKGQVCTDSLCSNNPTRYRPLFPKKTN